jgi:hypothetical protein
MSNAIVAKAINDSIGTQDFKGLNTILDEQLTRWDELFDDKLQKFNEAIEGLNPLTNVIYVPSMNNVLYNRSVSATYTGDKVIAKLFFRYAGSVYIRATEYESPNKLKGISANNPIKIYDAPQFNPDVFLFVSSTSSDKILSSWRVLHFPENTEITINGELFSSEGETNVRGDVLILGKTEFGLPSEIMINKEL